MEEYMKKLLVVMVTLGLALSMVFAADYATLEGEVASISKYGNAETDIKADEVAAAITMALHEKLNEFHDIESNVLTFKNSKTASSWGLKLLMMRQIPKR